MRSNLLFDFTINKENNTINVKKEFDANLDLVWEAWTNPEILDQWWAPKPWKTETVSMDFREGGMWLYYMAGPDGSRHYCKNDYLTIKIQESFSGLDAFCDEKGNTSAEMPRTNWTNTFAQNEETTLVTIVAQYESLEDLEKIIAMGFKEGFTMALGNLDDYFASLKK